jgi:hypothetical protein
LPGIGTYSLGSKFRTGTNCLGNFGRQEHLAAGPSSLIHRVKPKTLRRKSKDWLARNHDNVTKWSDMSTHGLLFQ